MASAPTSTGRSGLVPELFLRDLRGAARRGEHNEVQRLLADLEASGGQDPFYAESLSWAARAYLAKDFTAEATAYAQRAYALAVSLTGSDTVIAGSPLALAIGASVEVESQILLAAGKRDEAIAHLTEMEQTHAHQPFRIRIRKNLLSLTLVGQPALPLTWDALPGTAAGSENLLAGRPYVLYFWAHWCSDSRNQARALATLLAESARASIAVIAPTRLFGYITKGNPAPEEMETAHLQDVHRAEYPLLRTVPIPFGIANFERYGASTFPTWVGVDASGTVRLYHAGVLKPEAMAEALAPLLD